MTSSHGVNPPDEQSDSVRRVFTVEDSIVRIARNVLFLRQGELATIGRLPIERLRSWPDLKSDRMILTHERLEHLLSRHPETRHLLPHVLATALDPDEIHRNRSDGEIAIFWRLLDNERNYYLRAAIWLPLKEELAASILSARQTRHEDYAREGRQGRLVWKRET